LVGRCGASFLFRCRYNALAGAVVEYDEAIGDSIASLLTGRNDTLNLIAGSLSVSGGVTQSGSFFINGSSTTLIIGGGFTIGDDVDLENGATVIVAGTLVNGGTLEMDALPFDIGGELVVDGGLVNSGTIQLGNADYPGYPGGDSTLTVSGTLADSGTLDIYEDVASATVVSAGSLAGGGAINLNGFGAGAVELIVGSGAAPTTLSTTINLGGNSLLQFASGQIDSIGKTGTLSLDGSATFVADADNPTDDSALSGLSSVAGQFSLDGTDVSVSGGLTVSSGGTVVVGGSDDAVGSTLAVAGTLAVSGVLEIENTGIVSAAFLADSGTIALNVDDGGTAELLVMSGAAPATLNATIELQDTALLQYASGQITSIAKDAGLLIGGASSFVADADDPTESSALFGLSSIAGAFDVGNGAEVSITGNLNVTGTLGVDDADVYDAGGGLSVAGDLTNSGSVNIDYTIGNTDGSLQVAGDFSNYGTVNIDAYTNPPFQGGTRDQVIGFAGNRFDKFRVRIKSTYIDTVHTSQTKRLSPDPSIAGGLP
jgi:hypothetical protein